MKYHIGYWGGAGGDFLRGLIVSGLKDIETRWHDWRLWVKFDEWRHVVHVTGNGKIDVVGCMDIDDDRYRTIELGHEIGKPQNMIQYYLKDICGGDENSFQHYIFNAGRNVANENNGWLSNTSISVGHEHISFAHTFNGLNQFNTHMRNFRKNDKIIYISITTMEEANQRWINNSHKNNPDDKRRLPDEKRASIHLGEHQEIHDIILRDKVKSDVIFPFRYLYNKEYLRNWLEQEFDWNDRCYDKLYDAWYNKQDIIL